MVVAMDGEPEKNLKPALEIVALNFWTKEQQSRTVNSH
jgi:hypothetical protein